MCLDLDNDRHLAVKQVSINEGTCETTSKVCTHVTYPVVHLYCKIDTNITCV